MSSVTSAASSGRTDRDPERRSEREAGPETRKADRYLERQARREAVPALKRQVRQTVPYLERKAAREADRARQAGDAEVKSGG